MFKGILPSKRVASTTDFTMVTPLGDTNLNVDSNQPTAKGKPALSSKGFPSNAEKRHQRSESKWLKQTQAQKEEEPVVVDTNQAFDKLLDDLQIPPTLRPKLTGMDSNVKAAMIKSSHVLTLPKPTADAPSTPNRSMGLRRTRSTESFGSPMTMGNNSEYDLRPPQLPFAPQVSAQHPSSIGTPRKASGHSRGVSFDGSRSQLHLPMSGSFVDLPSMGKTGKEKGAAPGKTMSPTKIISTMLSTSSTQIDVEHVKKLRLLLRNEPASWTQEFLQQDGYSAMLTRLNEILEVEWREEQHDDQVLHELLRCFKALATSSIGAYALRSSCPTPWTQLVSLLYSDKKPGEVATRQLIVELLLILFEIYPPSALPAPGSPHRSRVARREAWESSSDLPGSASRIVNLPAPHKTFYSLIRALLLTPAPAPAEAPAAPVSPHEFIESLHRPRLYKTYLQELSDVCRDYFWVFCHPNNTIWVLAETDETRVEKPRAPGGMTGGVEFEAMSYFTTHLRLINAVAKACADLNMPKDNELSAYKFHHDLFLSGLERIILIARKASTTYYPTLHLELARYMEHAARAGYEIPWAVSRLMGPPPAPACKNKTAPSAPSTPTPAGRKTPSGARDRR